MQQSFRRTYNGHGRSVSARNGSHFRRNERGEITSSSIRRGSFKQNGPSPHRGRSSRVQKTFDVSRFINKNPVTQTQEAPYTPKHRFSDFALDNRVSRSVVKAGLSLPTEIQDQIIPHILEGRDVIGLANTGTGKTAAFLIPLIHKTLHEYSRETLILTPTRELALQIDAELKKLTPGLKLYSSVCVGGTNIRPQISALRRKNHFIIGTPGRVIDLMDRGALRLHTIRTVVLDEADRMLDMGFIHDMKKILSGVPSEHETLFFSATLSDDIAKLVNDFLKNPLTISVRKQDIASSIEQDVVRCSIDEKFDVLSSLLRKEECSRVVVFGAMKHSVEKLANSLKKCGIDAESIHGNKSHPQRQRSLKRFKEGYAKVLVATDVAARGIHVDNVSHVINYDLPATYEDYIHRIGRTGRGKERGKALTFVS